MKKTRTWIALALIAAASGAAYYVGDDWPKLVARFGGGPAGPSSASKAGGGAAPQALPIESAVARVDVATTEINAVGTLLSDASVVLAPEIVGRVSQILFKDGDRVQQGQQLVRLDDAIPRAELAQAKAQLTLSRSNFARIDQLAQARTATERSRDEAVAKLQVDQASAALAETKLERHVVVAPFPGVVGLRRVDVGAYVAAGTPLVNIEKIDTLRLDFQVSETFLKSVRVGQEIQVQVDARPNERFTGTIAAIDPKVEEAGRAIRVRARLPNADDKLRPGLFARVLIIAERRENAVFVPEAAVIARPNDTVVYRIVDGKARLAQVKIGVRRPGEVEILEGLSAGAVIAVGGLARVRDGSAVTIIGGAQPSSGAPAVGSSGTSSGADRSALPQQAGSKP
ncbi:MAG: efflux RND transporter periplasmic adaptor subunit [Alphaproteobacteria bacterium]|nr:efflux RND transporter periplasmic adaptor subunit [Alphaproteobacteria bacterium]